MTISYLQGVQARPAPLSCRATRSTPLVVTGLEPQGKQQLISAAGAVDAGNAKSFADQVCAVITATDAVHDTCLDLSELDFFGVDGCTALHAVNALVMRLGADWTVIPSAAVSRVLQLCDPACLIPVNSVEELAEPA